MQLVTTKLDEKTRLVQHYEDSFINNVLNIGKELKSVKDEKIYKDKFKTWESYIQENFRFSTDYADKAIQSYEKYGQNPERFGNLFSLSSMKLI